MSARYAATSPVELGRPPIAPCDPIRAMVVVANDTVAKRLSAHARRTSRRLAAHTIERIGNRRDAALAIAETEQTDNAEVGVRVGGAIRQLERVPSFRGTRTERDGVTQPWRLGQRRALERGTRQITAVFPSTPYDNEQPAVAFRRIGRAWRENGL
jgi:hypothetical protein